MLACSQAAGAACEQTGHLYLAWPAVPPARSLLPCEPPPVNPPELQREIQPKYKISGGLIQPSELDYKYSSKGEPSITTEVFQNIT